MDANRDGTISKDEILAAFKAAGVELTAEEVWDMTLTLTLTLTLTHSSTRRSRR